MRGESNKVAVCRYLDLLRSSLCILHFFFRSRLAVLMLSRFAKSMSFRGCAVSGGGGGGRDPWWFESSGC